MGLKKRFLYIGTMLLFVIFMLQSNIVSAQTINEKLNDLQQKEKQLKEEQSEINSGINDTKSKIAENKSKQQTVNNEIADIDQKLSKTNEDIEQKENEISETNQEIDQLNADLKQLKADIKELEERIEKREALLKDRLRAMQQNGGMIKYLEVIFGSQSFGDFITRSAAVNTIMDQDKTIMEEHAADKAELEDKKIELDLKKKEVEAKKKALEKQMGDLESLKSQLDSQLAQKEKLMTQLEEEQIHLEDYVMSMEEEQQVLREQAAIVKKAKNDALQEKARIEATQNHSGSNELSAGGSGDLNWPASGRLSSNYGHRSFNGGGFHYGIDIAAAQGTPVYAAASGVVTRANYSSSYGNVIYIYHSSIDKTTVYAHLHSMSVSSGEEVSAGQQIGGIGNTGRSFGNHLHFEVHNGLWSQHGGVNPMNFLK